MQILWYPQAARGWHVQMHVSVCVCVCLCVSVCGCLWLCVAVCGCVCVLCGLAFVQEGVCPPLQLVGMYV